MGHAPAAPAIDLPDPDKQPPAAPLASADDLLAQLAGEEIDRLLAESEGENPHAESDAQRQADDAVAVAASPDSRATESPVISAVPVAASPLPVDADALAAAEDEINALLNEPPNKSEAPGKSELPAPTESIAAQEPLIAPHAEPPAPPNAVAPRLSAAEELASELEAEESLHAALNTDVAAHNSITDSAIGHGSEESATPEPLLVRVLEVVNSPLDYLPESVREALGKIAILTLFNAVCVLLYVLLFRRHH